MTHYTIIAYKPDSIDTCRGCVMKTYSSDFYIEETDDRQAAIQLIANYKSIESGYGEADFEITLLFNGFTQYNIEDDIDYFLILKKADLLSDEIRKRNKLENEKREEQLRLEKEENQKKYDLEKFLVLKEKLNL